MTPEEAARTPKVEISPPTPRQFELRMIVWNTKDCVFKDNVCASLFVTIGLIVFRRK